MNTNRFDQLAKLDIKSGVFKLDKKSCDLSRFLEIMKYIGFHVTVIFFGDETIDIHYDIIRGVEPK